VGPILRANCYSRHRYEVRALPCPRRVFLFVTGFGAACRPARTRLAGAPPRAGGLVAASPGCRSHARGADARWTQDGELLFTH